jgi:isoquinoline 1-oxidoreductase alpha subunit
MIRFILNDQTVDVDVDPDTPLLWVVRDVLGLKGSKFGCGAGLCGACSMLLDGDAVRTCVLPIATVEGRRVTTIEGLGTPDAPSPVQRAWAEQSVAQCGYCQSGQIIAATALLASNPDPDDDAIDAAMSGNLCRCGTYNAIRSAIQSLKGTDKRALFTEVRS